MVCCDPRNDAEAAPSELCTACAIRSETERPGRQREGVKAAKRRREALTPGHYHQGWSPGGGHMVTPFRWFVPTQRHPATQPSKWARRSEAEPH